MAASAVAQQVRTVDQPEIKAAVFDPVRQRHVAIGAYGETLELDGASWRQRALPRLPLTPTSTTTAVFDGRTGRTLMIHSPSEYVVGPIDLAAFDGVEWRSLTAPTGPLNRIMFATTFDEVRGELVLFGGYASSPWGLLSDTWAFDGMTWSQRTTATAPSARVGATMVYDAARARVVLFGGSAFFTLFDDTWEWDGSGWIPINVATRPPGRRFAAMTFDRLRGRVVIFSGDSFGFTGLVDTWEYDGLSWISTNPAASPPARSGASFTFDDGRLECLLAGGAGANPGEYSRDTWSWNGTRWQLVSGPAHPESLYNAAVAAGPGGGIVLIDGYGPSAPESWFFDGQGWNAVPGPVPPRRGGAATATGPQYAYVYGGSSQTTQHTDLWRFDGAVWSQLSTAPGPVSDGMGMTFDWANSELVMFGGTTTSPVSNTTWSFSAGNWVQRAPATSPPARVDCAMAYDLGRQRVVMHGGRGAAGNWLLDTWEWDGVNWSQVLTANYPTAGRGSMAYDGSRNVITLMVESFSLFSGRIWEFDGQNWQARTVPDTPQKTVRPMSLVGNAWLRGVYLVDDRNVYSMGDGQPAVEHFGVACTANSPDLTVDRWPSLSSSAAVEVVGASPGAFVALLGAVGPANLPVAGCTQLVQPGQAVILLGTSPAGIATAPLPLPAAQIFHGLELYFQTAALDATALAGVTFSRGLKITLGN